MKLKGFAALVAAIVIVGLVPAAAVAKIRITKIVYDPSGPDYTSNHQLNAEYVTLHNTGNHRKNLRHWVLKDRSGHRYRFSRFKLGPNKYVRIHTGSGRNDRHDLHWGQGNFVWNNDGDRATLKNRSGNRVDRCGYSGGPSPNPPKKC